MQLGRRDLLKFAGAGAATGMLSGAAQAQQWAAKVAIPPQATAPRFAAPAGVDAPLFERARAALQRHAGTVRYRDRVGIVDFGLRSDEPRFHVVDMLSGQAKSFLVAHGSGSDANHNGWLDRFSNQYNSNATSNGAYQTANRYNGKYGVSMKLHGLDATNSNAFGRYIVMHSAWYAESDMIAKHGKLGRSQGCFALGRHDHWNAMDLLGDGRMIFADKLA